MISYFLGLDGGGTRTSAIVVDRSMTVLGEARAGPSNFLRVGIDEAKRSLHDAIARAAADAGIEIADIEYAWCGIAGFDHPVHGQLLDEAVRAIFPQGNFTISTDARIALTAAFGLGPGIVLIAGTGSVAFGRNAMGDEARVGGWGAILGDEGSAYSIARHAMRAVMKSWDGRGPFTRMTELFCTELQIDGPRDLPVIIYAPSTHSDTIAGYLRMVARAADAGDEIAKQIFELEGHELGVMVVAVSRKLGMVDADIPVACVGGAFHAGDLLLEPIRRTIESLAPHARIIPGIESPVKGAAQMAIRAAGQPIHAK